MPFVKIFLMERLGSYYDNSDVNSEIEILSEGISDWEEISDDDLNFLRNNLNLLAPYYGKQYSPRLIVKDSQSVRERIQSIKDLILKQKLRRERELTEEIQKKENRKKKSKLKIFEKLKKELEDSGEI